MIIQSTMQGARERYQAYLRGEYIPPPKQPQVVLTEAETEEMLDIFAAVLAKMYKEEVEQCVTT